MRKFNKIKGQRVNFRNFDKLLAQALATQKIKKAQVFYATNLQ
jgi:hypothetical protein